MARPNCGQCGRKTTEANLDAREGLCAKCFRLSRLSDFDARKARSMIASGLEGNFFRANGSLQGAKNFEQIAADMRRFMRPPEGREWNLILVAEVWCAGLKWPVKEAA